VVKKAAHGRLEKKLFIAATIIPGLIPIFLFFFYPVAYAFWVSIHNFNLKILDRSFVGLKNYVDVVTSYYFWNTMKVTVIFAVLSFLMIIVLATATALLLNEKFRGQKILQVLVLVPWAIPYVVGGSMWKWIYNADFGLLNAMLLQLGVIHEFQPWLTNPNFHCQHCLF
jgi:ABC-type sugar transport system permease subunit